MSFTVFPDLSISKSENRVFLRENKKTVLLLRHISCCASAYNILYGAVIAVV